MDANDLPVISFVKNNTAQCLQRIVRCCFIIVL